MCNYRRAEGRSVSQSVMKGPSRLDIQLHDRVAVRRDRWPLHAPKVCATVNLASIMRSQRGGGGGGNCGGAAL